MRRGHVSQWMKRNDHTAWNLILMTLSNALTDLWTCWYQVRRFEQSVAGSVVAENLKVTFVHLLCVAAIWSAKMVVFFSWRVQPSPQASVCLEFGTESLGMAPNEKWELSLYIIINKNMSKRHSVILSSKIQIKLNPIM